MRSRILLPAVAAGLVIGAVVATTCMPGLAIAAGIEKPRITLAVGGRTLVAYLSLAIAVHRDAFRKEGLDVAITDFQGGGKPLEALVGGSADIACGAYEHTLYMAAKGIAVKSFALQNSSFGLVIAMAKSKAGAYKSVQDLKGLNVGVTGPGSASAVGLAILLAKGGLTLKDVAVIGVGGGAGAVAAVKMGKLDAIANFDPAISLLERDGAIQPIIDTRDDKDLDYLYGGPFAASSYYAKAEFVAANPGTIQAFANAINASLAWLAKASTDEIVDAVPAEYYAGDRATYRTIIERNRGRLSPDGRIPPEAAERTYRNLAAFEETFKGVKIDLGSTYDNSFVVRAVASRGK